MIIRKANHLQPPLKHLSKLHAAASKSPYLTGFGAVYCKTNFHGKYALEPTPTITDMSLRPASLPITGHVKNGRGRCFSQINAPSLTL
mmetsp:Transcript_3794/g.10518  ORF Transcript_3794/g.10518 Transcript_3794/m.10518 type:complete len:88 (-) Transcript_3794:967-1230(-)